MKKFMGEFKEFISKGNVIGLAVGVIIGGAFTAIVNAVVTNILNPLLGLITGNMDLENALIVSIETPNGNAELLFGALISAVITFLLTAFVLFLLVKGINNLQKKKEEAPAPAPDPEPTKEELLLTEIRDLLKK